jgi:hypothetical protein
VSSHLNLKLRLKSKNAIAVQTAGNIILLSVFADLLFQIQSKLTAYSTHANYYSQYGYGHGDSPLSLNLLVNTVISSTNKMRHCFVKLELRGTFVSRNYNNYNYMGVLNVGATCDSHETCSSRLLRSRLRRSILPFKLLTGRYTVIYSSGFCFFASASFRPETRAIHCSKARTVPPSLLTVSMYSSVRLLSYVMPAPA